MEAITKTSWALLALLHLLPALPLFIPALVERLYGVPVTGEAGVLLIHRGALFWAVLVAAIYALLDPTVRRLGTIVVAISMIGFLIVYARAGLPDGALRKVAVADLIGLVPLAWVAWQAWR
jgi:hypothetical protein